MAPSAKPQGGQATANAQSAKPSTSNGVITEPPAPAVNRKKAKRRAKEKARRDAAAHQRAADDYASDDLDDTDLAPPGGYPAVSQAQHPPGMQYDPRYPNAASQLDQPNGTGYEYSDDDNQDPDEPGYAGSNGVDEDGPGGLHGKKNKKKKKKAKSSQYDASYEEQPSSSYYNPPSQRQRATPTITEDALRTVEQKVKEDAWETSTREERDRIRQFWTKLPEKDRRDLVKIEKDAVLKKMKEQQKHSCSCTVCGRKRTAIEEELEILYNAYYDELEHYANNGQRPPPPPSFPPDQLGSLPQKPNLSHAKEPSRGRIQELADDGDDVDELDEDFDEYGDGVDDYSGDEYRTGHGFDVQAARKHDFFTFGKNLTVKGGILTVADDLLSNHGEKFIDMMEQLANARMRRETEAYESYRNSHVTHDLHGNHYPEEDDFEDEEDFEDDDSQADDFDEDDEMDAMTDTQRMDEGRRMFQIFAARMFEQRVLGAYRDDLSKKKADQLIAEEEAEKQGGVQREAKKAREAEKKKVKKQQKKQVEAEKKQKREAEKAEADRLAREAEEKRQEELRQKREEQRKKREAEKRAQDEEKRRKEEEKRRLQEEAKAKQQERERQAREQKAAEKRRKDEERKKQQEDKDAKAAAARERKAQQDKEQREKEQKAKAEAEAAERKRKEDEYARKQFAQTDAARKAPPPAVALPPSLKQQKSQTGSQASPQAKATTPAMPKATTPQQKQPSGSASQASSSQEQDASHSSKQSTPPIQPGPATSHPTSAGSTRAPSRQPQPPHPAQGTSPHPVGPPPGMPYPPQTNFPGMHPHAINGFPAGAGMTTVHPTFGAGRGGYPMGPQLNIPYRPGPQGPHFPQHSMPQGPPGMAGRGFSHDAPSVNNPYYPPKGYAGPRPAQPAQQQPVGSHSRQPSSSFETSPSDNIHAPQPIGRPQPIQRPDSTKPDQMSAKARTQSMPQGNKDPDGDAYLGSSALLGDAEPIQDAMERRQTAPHLSSSATPALGHAPFGHDPPQPFGTRPNPGFASPIAGNAAGWTSGWAGPSSFAGGLPRRHGAPRSTILRRLACETLIATPPMGNMENTQEIRNLLNHINASRPSQEPPVQMPELRDILETEGDAQNGGGMFNLNQLGTAELVSFTRGDSTPVGLGVQRGSVIGGSTAPPTGGGLGEIGSPLSSARGPDVRREF